MSKASEWARREDERQRRLEAARDRIDREMDADAADKPTAFIRDRNTVFSVVRADNHPRMCVHAFSSSLWLTETEAIEAARWILATFADGAEG